MNGTEHALSRKMSGGLFCIHIDVEANGNDETYSKRAGFIVRLSGVISCELSIEGDDPLRSPVLSESGSHVLIIPFSCRGPSDRRGLLWPQTDCGEGRRKRTMRELEVQIGNSG